MASNDEPTGFEWLDRPFMMTRILVTLQLTLFLGLSGDHLITNLMFWPSMDLRQLVFFSILCLILPASSLVLLWQRPRIGFLIVGFGVCPLSALIRWPLVWLCWTAWLCFAAWKVGPGRSAPDVILPPCD